MAGVPFGVRELPTREMILWREGDPPVGLYIHVPFCRALCTYCTFAKDLYDGGAAQRWLEGIVQEITVRRRSTWRGRPLLDTVFLGGGTPSALTPAAWERLGGILREHFELLPDVEFTSEANPESFDASIAGAMRTAGVNRVSLGSQSFDSGELQMLGRRHDAGGPGRAVAIARAAGLGNLSLDLMYGLPDQSVESFGRSLDAALALGPDHLSAYCLSLDPGTELTQAVTGGRLPPPEEDLAALQYELLTSRLGSAGFEQYEISNFSRPGRESRHNLRYWTRSDVAALGPSSHALLGGHRWVNPAPLEGWVRAYQDDAGAPIPRPVPEREARFEWVFLHLRLNQGLSLEEYARRWGEPLFTTHKEVVTRLVGEGLLEMGEGRLRLCDRARFVSDSVFAEFAP